MTTAQVMPSQQLASPPRSSRAPIITLITLTLLTALARGYVVVLQPLLGLESNTRYDAQRGLGILLRWAHNHDHPPLSYILVRLCIKLTGSQAEWVLRLPTYLAGLVAIPLGYLLVKRLASARAGLIAALLLTVDPILWEQSTRARMYAITVALMLAALLTLHHAATSPTIRRHWITLGVVLAALLWTSNLGLIVTASVLITCFSILRGRGPRLTLLSTLALGFMAPVHLIARIRSGHHDRLPGTTFAHGLAESLDTIAHLAGSPAVSMPLALAGVVGLVLLARRSRPLALTLGLIVLLSPLAVATARTDHYHNATYYFIVFQAAVIVGLAVLLERTRWSPLIAGALALLLSSVTVDRLFVHRPPEDRAVAAERSLVGRMSPADRAAVIPASHVLEYYVPEPQVLQHPTTDPVSGELWLVIGQDFNNYTLDEITRDVQPLIERWSAPFDRTAFANAWLPTQCVLAHVHNGTVTYEPCTSWK